MTNTHYLPGDRVQYVNGGSLHVHHMIGSFGTITEDKYGLEPLYPCVKWDNANFESGRYIAENINRQPIEAGCYVREVPGANVFSGNSVRKVIRVEDDNVLLPGFLGGAFSVNVDRLIRVAEPKPVKISLDLASGPDWTGFYIQTIGRAIRPDTLKQAQSLAETQETMRAFEKQRNDLDNQINRLAEFIMSEVPGEPSQSEGAVDAAIRIIREQQNAIQTAARRLAKWVKDAPTGYRTDESRAWLAQHAPDALPPTFKRGDLVTWGLGLADARIISEVDMRYPGVVIEVMYVDRNMAGTVTTIRLTELRHVETK